MTHLSKTYEFVPEHMTTVRIDDEGARLSTTFPDGHVQTGLYPRDRLEEYLVTSIPVEAQIEARIGGYVRRKIQIHYERAK